MYSIILLSYYSEKRIVNVFNRVSKALEQEQIPFEFIIMDDGSKDNSYQVALELEKQDSRVRSYQLSKNYTSHYSKFAAFTVCKGDCATSIPDDEQMPLEIIIKMYRTWQKGHKIVMPYRISRNDGKIKDSFSNLYYKMMNSITDVTFPKGGADGFLIDREVIDILNNQISPRNTSTTVEVLRLGFDPVFIPFERPTVKNKSRWTFKKKMKLAMDTILASSTFPIKFISRLGLLAFICSIGLIILLTYIKLTGQTSIGGVSMPGWTSILAFVAFFSGLILLSLGIVAEYIWKIHEEVKGRPGYIIKKK
ncbi:MAG TPA: glycosyltransferase [Bacteroidales bacterium]|nr:MAG: putative glycosyltransferase CsbB [Bacteroidetes bacterium ADurb.Bin217]HPM13103.1 glycosyltransferase [Bacteroidales bacterium]